MSNKHLWEIDHPYFCCDNNYYCYYDETENYESWEDFIEEKWGLNPSTRDEDHDLNLIFRWDWNINHDDYDEDNPNDSKFDDSHELKLYYMTQRKGIFRTVIIKVRKENEKDIIEFLKPRWEKMKELWEGIVS